MTIRGWALKILKQHIIQLNQYQIDDTFANYLAIGMLNNTKLKLIKGKDLSKPAVFIKDSNITIEQFDSLLDALDFAANECNVIGILCDGAVLEWARFKNGYIYKNKETNKIEIIKSIR